MSDILAGFIVKNKLKTISFLKKRNVNISINDSVLDISDKLHDYAGISDANANEVIDFITEGKSGFAWLTALFGGDKSKSELEASKNNTNAAIIESLTKKDDSKYMMFASIGLLLTLSIVIFILFKKD